MNHFIPAVGVSCRCEYDKTKRRTNKFPPLPPGEVGRGSGRVRAHADNRQVGWPSPARLLATSPGGEVNTPCPITQTAVDCLYWESSWYLGLRSFWCLLGSLSTLKRPSG